MCKVPSINIGFVQTPIIYAQLQGYVLFIDKYIGASDGETLDLIWPNSNSSLKYIYNSENSRDVIL
jgi:hypothetical protein